MNWRFFKLFEQTYFKCRAILVELNSLDPYTSSEREKEIPSSLFYAGYFFTSSTKREIGHFHVVVVQ